MKNKLKIYNNWFFPFVKPSDAQGVNISAQNFNIEDKQYINIFFREYFQNVLDARALDTRGSKKKVTINISVKPIRNEILRKYVGPLVKRLLAADHEKDIINNSADKNSVNCLVIEEDGTTGLRGETENSFLTGEDEQWNSFWIGEGNENKKGDKLGRRGQGKIVKHLVSGLSSVFAYSNQHDGKKGLLFGKCVFLKTYNFENKVYQWKGFFCDKKLVNEETQHIPIQNKEIINDFKKDFSITRTDNDGTSWLIPGIDAKRFNLQNIIKAIVSEFYIAITNEHLSINIDGKRIDAANLIKVIDDFDVFSESEGNYVKWVMSSFINQPNKVEVEKNWFLGSEKEANADAVKDIDGIKKKYNNNETISLDVPISLQRKGEESKLCNIQVYIKPNSKLERSRASYIRDCLIIDGEERWVRQAPGKCYGLVLSQDKDLIDFLGDAEDASHLTWNPEQANLKKNYISSEITLSQVRRSLPAFMKLFSQFQQEFYEDIFIDLLSIPMEKEKRKKQKKIKPVIPRIVPTKRLRIFDVNHDTNKLEIVAGPGASQISIPKTIYLKFAYSLLGEKGDPFKAYHRFDFDLGSKDFKFITNGCDVLDSSLNNIELQINDHNFSIQIQGFEENSVAIKETH